MQAPTPTTAAVAQSRRGLAACATLAIAAAAGAACRAGPAAAPVEEATVSPVYEAEHGGRTTTWRYVPLDARPGPVAYPVAAAFDATFARCAATARSGGAADAPPGDGAAGALAVCLAEHGFYEAQCSNGIDDDGDGAIDFGADPGCGEPHGLTESPQCDDGRDNDGDGLVDWDGGGVSHPDPECADQPSADREAPPPPRRSFLPF